MQPLTPAERREIELWKREVLENRSKCTTVIINDESIDIELWLKVLTMALECNEALETSWRHSYKAQGQAFDDTFDDAKRRLGR